MKLKSTILSVFAVVALGGVASASTVSVTEGDRDQIIGSTLADANGTGPGDTNTYDLTGLTNLQSGDELEIYGRIIGLSDTYQISAAREFRVQWIFNGYTTAAGFIADSGFVSTPVGGTGADAVVTMSDGVTTTSGVANPFSTDITAANGSNPSVFFSKFAAGSYDLKVDGKGVYPIDSLYDIRITAVPLPAGAILLLTGLAGLGVARRRRG